MSDPIESKVILVKNVPHGFYEKQMMSFFSQFGQVTRLRLLRSKKYGNSKGIAFIEFAYEDVAKIAAYTMNNYLMFEKLIKCELVPKKQLPPSVFKNWKSKRTSTILKHKHFARRIRDDKEWEKLKTKKLKNINETLGKLRALGIDYKCTMADEVVRSNDTSLLSLNGSVETNDESYVTCKSSPSPLRKSFGKKLSLTRSSMKRKLNCLPKFAILNAARRLSL